MKMSSRIRALMLMILLSFQICYVTALTNGLDAFALKAMKNEWSRFPESWEGSDPCGTNWIGITCNNDRVVSISLVNSSLEGKLSSSISFLSELHVLDLSLNIGLSGPLPPNIGDLKKLTNLILVGCSFSGQIPESIGSLEQLFYLSLNSNQFSGTIPASIGRLSKLYWFDISDNQIEGKLPISNGIFSPGLDMLLETKHFHFGNNKLSGEIPETLFSSNMTLIHVLFNENRFTGKVPNSLSLVKTLTIIRLDRNELSGNIPSSLNNLINLDALSLNSNQFSGTIPASIGRLSKLYWFDISDNQIKGKLPISNGTFSPGLDMLLETKHFHFGNNKLSGEIPETFFSSNMTLIHVLFNENRFTGKVPNSLSLVKTLTIIRLDRNELSGNIPSSLNNLINLDALDLSNNKFTGSLPSLTNLSMLTFLDVSNNPFKSSPIPSWISSLHLLATLNMEGIQLAGPIPMFLFSSVQLKTIILKRNRINGTLDFGTINNSHMESVDLQYNEIVDYKPPTNTRIQVILADNPVCKSGKQAELLPRNEHSSTCSTIPTNSSPYDQ